MARIKVINEQEAEGRLSEIYSELISKRGKIASVHKIQSLRPESIVKHMDLYLEIMYSKSELSRAEREMIAVVVSKSNNCSYCQIHHAEALNHYWKDLEKVEKLKIDFKNVELSAKQKLICEFATLLTFDPGAFNDVYYVENLKKNDFSDSSILDLVLVIAYFNFVNRIVLSLGVQIESETAGYNY